MKTLVLSLTRKGLAVAALAIGTFSAQAQDNAPYARSFEAAVYPAATPLKLWMIVDKSNHDNKPLKVEVLNSENKVMHSHVLPNRAPKVRQQFDMSDLANGTYTIRITDGKETIEKTFKLKPTALSEQLPQRYMTMN